MYKENKLGLLAVSGSSKQKNKNNNQKKKTKKYKINKCRGKITILTSVYVRNMCVVLMLLLLPINKWMWVYLNGEWYGFQVIERKKIIKKKKINKRKKKNERKIQGFFSFSPSLLDVWTKPKLILGVFHFVFIG